MYAIALGAAALAICLLWPRRPPAKDAPPAAKAKKPAAEAINRLGGLRPLIGMLLFTVLPNIAAFFARGKLSVLLLVLPALLRSLGIGKIIGGDARGEHYGGAHAAAQANGQMSEGEARVILQIEPGADSRAINAAYRRLMKENHPDKGGSEERAAKINLARDTLLRSCGK